MITLNSVPAPKNLTRAAGGAVNDELKIVYVFLNAGRTWIHTNAASLLAFSANENAVENHALAFLRPSALAILTHGLNFLEVIRAALGGCSTATATEGNGGGIFLCHAGIVQKAVAVCKRELCINSNTKWH